MTSRTRHILVGFLLGIYIVWPFVHQQLVLHYRINPWKLAGWAMYTTMLPRGNVTLVGFEEGGARVPLDARASSEILQARADYMSDRLMLGLFTDPTPFANAVARAYPRYTGWELTVNEIGLSDRGWVEMVHQSVYRYERTSDGSLRMSVSHLENEQESAQMGKS